ncbi:MAG: phosphoenolpyruvate carboxylase [Ilumatobacteraceae bacterium]
MSTPRALSDDIRLLGKMLGDVIADQAGDSTLELVETIRRVAVDSTADQSKLVELLDPLPIDKALHVIRAFSYFAMLANIAEDTDHGRRQRDRFCADRPSDRDPAQDDSVDPDRDRDLDGTPRPGCDDPHRRR